MEYLPPTADGVAAQLLPQVSEYLIYPWLLPGRLTLMVGPSNVGKTTLTLDMIAGCQTETHLWNWLPCKRIERVYYMHAEHTLATLQEAITLRGDVAPGVISIQHDFGTLMSRLLDNGNPRQSLIDALRYQIAKIRPQLIIAEPISAFLGSSENDNYAVRLCLNLLASLGAEVGAAVLTHHHLGKPKTDAMGRPLPAKEQGEARGAAAFEDAAECILYLKRVATHDTYHLRIDTPKIKGFPVSPVFLAFNQDQLLYTRVPQPAGERDLLAVYNWRRAHPDASTRELVEHFRGIWKGTRDATVYLLLKRAARVGLMGAFADSSSEAP